MPDECGRQSHLASFPTASDAVAYSRGIQAASILPGATAGDSIHYADLHRMEAEIKRARAA